MLISCSFSTRAELTQTSLSPIWWCSINTEVVGQPNHYLLYGRDAWDGESQMICHKGSREFAQKILIRFQSLNGGYGANANSSLRFTLTIWSAGVPFTFKSLVNGLIDGSFVHLQFSNSSFDLTGSVWTGQQTNAAQSLSLGTLTIQGLDH